MWKLCSNRMHEDICNKYAAFCMSGSVALWSPIPTFSDQTATDLQLAISSWLSSLKYYDSYQHY